MGSKQLSYKDSGVDIDEKNKAFDNLKDFVSNRSDRVLNSMGAFASLIDIKFDNYQEPVLVFKLEEPGTKQKLALEYGTLNTVAHDMINHLVNDIIVMGACPIAVQDLIVCGKLKDEIITPLVKSISEACENNECSLVGGETSEQPGVVDEEIHVLAASIIGVVEKNKVIDGSKIRPGDLLIAFSSNGLHTNGYSLVRRLIDENPKIVDQKVDGERFIDYVLRPHLTYYPAIKPLIQQDFVHGLAHITGGGIEGNLSRVIPDGLSAEVQLDQVKIPEIFKFIKEAGQVEEEDMLRTFNMGVGLVAVCAPEDYMKFSNIDFKDLEVYQIGEVSESDGTKSDSAKVKFSGNLKWP